MGFNKFPSIKIEGAHRVCTVGWKEIGEAVNSALTICSNKVKVVVVETYQGVNHDEILNGLKAHLKYDKIMLSQESMKSEEEILEMTFTDVTDDRIFGFMSSLDVVDFFDPLKLKEVKDTLLKAEDGVVVVYGHGASLIADAPDVLVYADMARWEIQQRMRRNEVDNLGIRNKDESIESKYKRAFFVDWRACDRLKQQLMNNWDFVLDTNKKKDPKMITSAAFDAAMEQSVNQPFSLVPFFDPGPWGGQWMREVCDLDKSEQNFAWCFNCVPEENSMLLEFENAIVEIPSINLVFNKPKQLLGENVYDRFGAEFPIRFDFLDTIGGSNLSLQVHPITEYIKAHFGMDYTQDESYYIMDAGSDAKVYLGVKDDVDSQAMIDDLREAQNGGALFDTDKYITKWDAKKHDHFSIPAGTVHCSGTDCMVLEISATPYIFTFKLWDWGRLGMDGKPRPINIEHGKNVIQWDKTLEWTSKNLINSIDPVDKGEGWTEERTGLHESEFIETRRHWFDDTVKHVTNETVNVVCLIEGDQAVVECPESTFEPFTVNYAETFVVPAQVKSYTISPSGISEGKQIATLKAYVR